MANEPKLGSIGWRDLTVEDADQVSEFYSKVVGWNIRRHPMDGYDDFEMCTPDGEETVAGICHARGANAGIPPQWLVYIQVGDVDASAARCRELGGEVLHGPRTLGEGKFCVIRDPAGAVCALHSS